MDDIDTDTDGELSVACEKPVLEGEGSQLPQEIILGILSFIPISAQSQRDLASLCLVSRSWYWAAVAKLYYRPDITSKNFDAFVRTICPSINQHVRPSHLSQYVQVLDMSKLTYHGSKTLTARILGRVKQNLISFFAPVTTFSLASHAALSKCSKLQLLSLAGCMEAIEIKPLFRAISKLPELRTLTLRSTRDSEKTMHHSSYNSYEWPPKLERLEITGRLLNATDDFLFQQLPGRAGNLHVLSIPAQTYAIFQQSNLYKDFGRNIHTFHLLSDSTPNSTWYAGNLTQILVSHPALRELSISEPFTTSFQRTSLDMLPTYPLELLIIDERHRPASFGQWPLHIVDRVESGLLTNLREVHVSQSIMDECQKQYDMVGVWAEELSQVLADLEAARAAEEGGGYIPRETGIFVIE